MLSRADPARVGLTALALAAAVCVALGAWTAPRAHAAAPITGPTVSLTPLGAASKPGYFVFSGRAGKTIRGTLAVSNMSSTAAGTIRLYGVDATTGQTTGAVYRSGTQPRRDVGRWIRLSTRRVTLKPRSRAVVSFTVRVPRGVRGGQHLGAIVAQPTAPIHRYKVSHGRFRIKVQALTVLAVQVNLPGRTVQRMGIGGCRVGGQHRYQTMFIGLRNRGSTLLKGRGRLTVTTPTGRRAKRQRFAVDTFVPHTRIAYPVVLRGKPLGPGRYRATVALSYGHHLHRRYGRPHRLRRTVTCVVSKRSIKQVFGSVASAPFGHGGGGGGPGVWLLVLGGVAVFVIGFGGAGLLYRSRLRPFPS